MVHAVKVAVVGLGWVALNRHLPAMDRKRKFEVVGVVDRGPGERKAPQPLYPRGETRRPT
jgi:predicted dehydrogenase